MIKKLLIFPDDSDATRKITLVSSSKQSERIDSKSGMTGGAEVIELKTVINRIYGDYFMPSRLEDYERLIVESLDAGFKHITIVNFFNLMKDNKQASKQASKQVDLGKYFIHRHDIDTDIKTAKKMFEIEKKYNIKSTYYFRLTTLDIRMMQEINEFGSEASYHFEEIATYCKTNHIKTKQEALEHIDKAREMFRKNIKVIEKKLGFKIESVASHGDFANRKLKLGNNDITNDMELRKELGIKVEAYDDIVLKNINVYISDAPYPKFYSPVSPFDAIKENNIICMLTHPGNWRTCPVENTKNNFKRAWEGLVW